MAKKKSRLSKARRYVSVEQLIGLTLQDVANVRRVIAELKRERQIED